MSNEGGLIRGLEGVVAATTRLCDLDGANGRLAYQGYDIEDLARHASFEEVVWLLWTGELPSAGDLAAFRRELVEAAPLPPELVRVLKLLPKAMHPMRVLQTGVALLGALDPDGEDSSPEANRRKATRLVARVASLTAGFQRIRNGRRPIAPRAELSHAANFLYTLSGRKPRVLQVRAFDAALVLYAEHELNASTFTARVVASTLSDMHSAVSAALGALKGPLHGGAGEAVMRTLEEIGTLENVDAFTRQALAARRRLMGFGHRVYRAGDPRAKILRSLAGRACQKSAEPMWFQLAVKLHEAAAREKGLIPNVDFYSAPLFRALGIPVDLFVPVIAVSRIAGWTANLLEQYADNRLIRPRADYVGPARRPFRPIAARET
ncbi:MAG TPA: citrate/2-methylcitrate synthase [Methylomirabilota bacterium]|nr:citrate/2-methylcitrate synthase [Methylomirabilota bacterium]